MRLDQLLKSVGVKLSPKVKYVPTVKIKERATKPVVKTTTRKK